MTRVVVAKGNANLCHPLQLGARQGSEINVIHEELKVAQREDGCEGDGGGLMDFETCGDESSTLLNVWRSSHWVPGGF